jgi:YggT family protein
MSILDFFISFLSFLCYLLIILIIARSVMSWLSPRPTNVLAIYLYKVTEPFLAPLRRILPRTGMVDFSPLIALIILYVILAILGRIH